MQRNSGFSLVELSIVLVILGLLVGGILGGQALIRAAELRSITIEYDKIQGAINQFKDKYLAIPGDMANATRFWGRADGGADTSVNCANPAENSDTGLPTCNGDGSGLLMNYGTLGFSEFFRFWEHLAAAGLIEGQYTGIHGSGGPYHAKIGVNVPASKLSNAAFSPYHWSDSLIANPASNVWPVDKYNYTRSLFFGREHPTSVPEFAILTPAEAWNIEKKIDDGKPGLGRLRMPRNNTACSTSAVQDTAEYNLSNNTVLCYFVFLDVY